jgi:hypothetical protein
MAASLTRWAGIADEVAARLDHDFWSCAGEILRQRFLNGLSVSRKRWNWSTIMCRKTSAKIEKSKIEVIL